MEPRSTGLLSAEDLLDPRFPVEHCELVAGVVRHMTPANAPHGLVASRLLVELAQHVYPRKLGLLFTAEAGFVLRRNPDTVRAPDVAFVAAERLTPEGLDHKFFEGAPDIAGEVVSPRNRLREIHRKIGEYLGAGGRLVWVLHPRKRTVTAYAADGVVRRLGEDEELDAAPVLSEFRCAVATLFEGVRRV